MFRRIPPPVALLLLAPVLALAAATQPGAAAAVGSLVATLTPERFTELQAKPHLHGGPLLVRFYFPWEGEVTAAAAFEEAASIATPDVCEFAELPLDSLDAFVVADALSITSFPAVRLFNTAIARPAAPKGNIVVGRPTFLAQEFRGNQSSASELVEFLLLHTPTRVVDPLTSHLTQSVLQIQDASHIAALARVAPPTAKHGALFYLPTTFRSDKKHGTALRHNLLLNSIHVQAARHNQRILVFVTSDASVAELFGLGEHGTAAAFLLSEVAGGVGSGEQRKTVATRVVADTPAAVRRFFDEHATDVAVLEKELGYAMRQWRLDMAGFVGKSPLRKLETSEQFAREVTNNKAGAIVLFLLRESDKFFTKHHQVAVDAATWARGVSNVNPVTGEPHAAPGLRFEVFWVDAEVHPELAKKLLVKAVPSVGVILSLQQQDGANVPPKGVKYVTGSSTNEFPDAKRLLAFLASPQVFEGKDILPFDPAGARLNDGGRSTQPQLHTPLNNAYLGLDPRSYDEDEPEADTFMPGRKREGDPGLGGGDSGARSGKDSKRKKLSPEREQVKKAKQEAEKARIAEELARKKAEKEERIRKKAEEDKHRKEKEVADAKRLREERRKNPEKFRGAGEGAKAKTGKAASVGGQESKASAAERLAQLRKSKKPKDRAALRKQWEKEGLEMARKYLSADGAQLRVKQNLELA